MALDDFAVGADDYNPQRILDDLVDQQAAGVRPDTSNVNLDDMAQRLARKVQARRQGAEVTRATPRYSDFGTPVDQTSDQPPGPSASSPRTSDFGELVEPAKDATPPPETKPPTTAGAPDEDRASLGPLGESIGEGAVSGVGSALKGVPVGASALRKAAERAPEMAAGGLPGLDPTPFPKETVRPEQNPLYKAGEAVQKWARETSPLTPEERETFQAKVGRGIGGMVVPFTAGLVLGPAGVAVGAGTMGLQATGDTYDAAIAKGASPDAAAKAAGIDGAIGAALGALPLGVIMKPVTQTAPGLVGWATAKLWQAARSGITFATIGEAQHYLGQQVAREFYDPKAGYDPSIERLLVNLTVGAAIGPLHPLAPARGTVTAGENPAVPGAPPADGSAPRPETPPGPEPEPAAPDGSRRPRASDDDLLRRYGHSDEDIAAMSPEDKAAEVKDALDAFVHVAHDNRAEFADVAAAKGLTPGTDEYMKEYDRWVDRQKEGKPKPEGRELSDQALEELIAETSGTRAAPTEDLSQAESKVAEPTPAQAAAENYAHGHLEVPELGLTGKNNISVETKAGGTRNGPVDPKTGKPEWTATMPATYGRIKGTVGMDGEPLDIHIGKAPPGGPVFVIDQKDPATGKPDEHKIFARFASPEEAVQAYLGGHDAQGPSRIGGMRAMTPDEFQTWVKSGKTDEPLSDAMLAARGTEAPKDATKAPKAPSKTGLGDLGSAGAAISDNMYEMLWKKVQAGDTTENGAESAILQAAKMVRGRGGLQNIDEFKDFAADYARIDRSPNFQSDMRALVAEHSPEATADHHAAIETAVRDAGEDPHNIRSVDLHRAAEIHAEEGLEPKDALLAAAVRSAVEDGELTPKQVKETFTDAHTAETLLGSATGAARELRAQEGGAAIGRETAPAAAGEDLPGGGAHGGEGREGAKAAEDETAEPEGGAVAHPEREAAGEPDAGRAAAGAKSEQAERAAARRKPAAKPDDVEADDAAERGARPEREPAEPAVIAKSVKPAKPKPRTLLEFVAAHGGLQPDADWTSMGLDYKTRVTVPGMGPRQVISSKRGMSIDELIEQMEAHGFLPKTPDSQAGDTGVYARVREMVDEELRGRPSYPMGQGPEKKVDRGEALHEADGRLQEALETAQLPRDAVLPEDYQLATEIMVDEDVSDPIEALERATMRNEQNSGMVDDATIAETDAEEAYGDAAQPQTAPGDREGAPAESAEPAEGAGREGVEAGEHAPRAGEGGGAAAEPAAERPKSERTHAGEQHVIPGAERIPDAELAQRKSDERLKPAVAQKPADIGLFGDESKQTDLVDLARNGDRATHKDKTSDLSTPTEGGKVAPKEVGHEPSGSGEQGPSALEQVATEQGGRAPGEGRTELVDTGGGEGGPAGDRAPESEGLPGTRGRGNRPDASHPFTAGAGEQQPGVGEGRTGAEGARVPETPAGPSGRGGVAPEQAPSLPAINFRITGEVNLGQGSELTKFNDNLAAIRTLKTIERENRRATPQEQVALARYVGWGGLANAFSDPSGAFKDGWEDRGKELASLLTPEEIRAARRSTRNAHYTSKAVVDAMWQAARRLGFNGGLALELSAGTGNFIGLVPEDIAGRTRFIGVEYDSLTQRIAQSLYPQETVLHSGLQHVPLPAGEAVLNIGNPPFGAESLRFQYKPELNGLSIHNQFFLAGLDAVRPGGLQIMVVSRYLMDAQDKSARLRIATKANLLGAIRLPETAFLENARTEVVTDILFLQRRTPDDEAQMEEAVIASQAMKKKGGAELDRKALARMIPDWVEVGAMRDPLGGEDMPVNNYFVDNPHMVMGQMDRSGTMRQKGELTVKVPKGADLAALLRKAVDRLPEKVLDLDQETVDRTLARHQSMAESLAIAIAGNEPGHIEKSQDGKLTQVFERETPSGGYEVAKREITPETPWSRDLFMDDQGQWYKLEATVDAAGKKVKQGTRNVYERKYFPDNVVPPGQRLGQTKFKRLNEIVALRDLTKRQLTLETNDAPAAEMEANRKKLAAAYRDFVKAHGLINEQATAALLGEMPDGALVSALELNYRRAVSEAKAKRIGEKPKPASADPAPIMKRRVVPKFEPATKAANPADAISISLSERGHVDIDRVASLLGKTKDEADAAVTGGDKPLVFYDPELQRWETRNDYLTGLVARKLKAARAAGLAQNVKELEAVQPERWTAENVNVLLGSSWVPPEVYGDFIGHLVGEKATVRYSKLTNSFDVTMPDRPDAAKLPQWRTEDAPLGWLYSRILNSQGIKIIREDSDGNKWVDQEATALAQLKANEIHNEFAEWVFRDSERRNKLVDIFNDKFNTRVTRQHDGSHLQLPGKVPDEVISLRRHQKNAIWRGIHERFVLLDHVVGAGKTFTEIATIMERRRMGLSRKPMVVVPNHLVAQWTADVYRLYPGAKVLAAGANQFDRANRRKLFAKIATGDWDIVIVPHSSFGFIGVAPETELRFLDEELRIAQAAIEEAWEQAREDGQDGGRRKPFNVKEAERLATKIQERMDALRNSKRDRMLTFEQMGIDHLAVDEAHEFKNLFYSSRLTGVRGMGNKTGSQKAFDLYTKVRVLRENPNGSIAFLTGTPISNSAVEMYTMMRYLAAHELRDLGLEHFDAWRAQSVSAAAKFEPTEAGGLKEVTRLGRSWSNMRALMELYYSFTDAVSQEDINRWYAEDNKGAKFPVPDVVGGSRKEVVVKPTPAQSEMLTEVVEGFNSLPSITDPDERNIERLKLMDRARKLSLDVRAVDGRHPSKEVGGKLDQMADRIAAIYKKWDKDAGTQLIFLDRSVKAAKTDAKEIKQYDELLKRRDAAAAAGDEEAFRRVVDELEKMDANHIEELRRAQAGGWNAYDQLKANLVKREVKADEIRFVQEANNDAEKKAIFDAVNDGKIRVLIGSTQKMGAGTNVQERLTALHHGDVTWKPSDIEQREGRIIRQGNKLLDKYGDKFAVDILAYVTERTVDAKMWDLNATKLKMINGIRKYDGSFSMEFEDEDAVGMAEIAALASGDPLLMDRVKLVSEIDKLELLERAHRRKVFGLEDQIERAERAIKENPARIKDVEAKAAELTKEFDKLKAIVDKRRITIEGKQYDSAVKAHAAVLDAIKAQQGEDEHAKYAVNVNGTRLTTRNDIDHAVADTLGDQSNPFEVTIDGKPVVTRARVAKLISDRLNSSNKKEDSFIIGEMLGAELHADTSAGSLTLSLDRRGRTLASGDYWATGKDKKGEAFSPQAVRAALDRLEDSARSTATSTGRWLESQMAEAKKTLPGLREDLGKPFKQAPELKEKRGKLEAVINELAARTEAAEKGGTQTKLPIDPPNLRPMLSSYEAMRRIGHTGEPGSGFGAEEGFPFRQIAARPEFSIGDQTVIVPASQEAAKLLKHAKGDLAHALALVDGRLQLYAGRFPEMHAYNTEIKDEIIRQADPKEVERLRKLELLQEQLGGELYGGEPRGLVNWLRSRSSGGALEPPTIGGLPEFSMAPAFYSAVERAVSAAKMEKARPDQWLGTVKNAPGVKPEELHRLGLAEWLGSLIPPSSKTGERSTAVSVTKAEVLDYIRARIEVKERSGIEATAAELPAPRDDLEPRPGRNDAIRPSRYLTPQGFNKRAVLESGLTEQLRHMLGEHVTVKFSDKIEAASHPHAIEEWGSAASGFTTVGGVYYPAERIIEIALYDPKYRRPDRTAWHEAQHFAEDHLYSDQELELTKRETPRMREWVRDAMGVTQEQADSMSDREIRAEAFRFFAQERAEGRDRSRGLHIGVRKAFHKVIAFLDRIKSYLRGEGFQTVDDVFSKLYGGKMAARDLVKTQVVHARKIAQAEEASLGSVAADARRRVEDSELRRGLKDFYTSGFQPELVSDKALRSDPLFARYRAASAQEKDAIIKQSQKDWDFFNKRSEADNLRFLDNWERRLPQGDPELDALAARYKAILDAGWEKDQRWGSTAAYVEDYMPHVWVRPDDFRKRIQGQTQQIGPTWFQKHRFYDFITEGLEAGLKLKFTNPIDLINHRLISGSDMRQRMELLYRLRDMGLARSPREEGVPLLKTLTRRGWLAINAPDRAMWFIAPDVQPLWENAVKAQGLWQAEHVGGTIFRQWMALKNVWVPVKLALSMFHPLHVLHIDQANSFARAWTELTRNKDAGQALRAAGEALATFPTLGAVHAKQGARARAAWQKRPDEQTPEEKAIVGLMTDGGFSPQLSEQLKINARKKLAELWQQGKYGRAISPALRRGIEVFQAPIFERWIPSLKAAAYLNEVHSILRRRPELLTNDEQRRAAFRVVGKAIDDRFGEMFYGTLFWNRTGKDVAIGSFLSLGWNLGFARQFLAAPGEAAAKVAFGGGGQGGAGGGRGGGIFGAGFGPEGSMFHPSETRRTMRNASSKVPFVLAYVSTAMLLAGMMSYLLSGEFPTGIDYIFPRVGGKNPDGSPRRITTMFYTREIPMLLKHVQERGGNWLTGAGAMLWNKLMFQPFAELIQNRTYWGYEIWDTNAPLWKQSWQAVKHILGEQTHPMSISGAQRGLETGGTWTKDVPLAGLGFGPAPRYVEKSAAQNRIAFLYERRFGGTRTEEESETARDKVAARNAIMMARQNRDSAALQDAIKKARAAGMTPDQINKVGRTQSDVSMFKRLPASDQRAILREATDEEFKKYMREAHKDVKVLPEVRDRQTQIAAPAQ